MAARRRSADQPTAEPFLPARRTLPALRAAADGCRGCDLYLTATQTVFGEGPARSRVMFVGEQPGDSEDRQGRPFVGPAGKLFDRALSEAGLVREEAYVTNAVKHFKFEQRGKARLHKRPKAGEIGACLPWLHAEIAAIEPEVLVLLGATAGQALFGPRFRISEQRGRPIPSDLAGLVLATAHPSAILRAPDAESRASAFRDLVSDLKLVKRALDKGR
ncbi:MAG TPA: UdgX family uracil-DNA binding protein [Polyangiaceae bacterium]|nr:UdgX family uracil-DNA binding protein [Polyangiaceae bacterium]